jgi:hypothetical protein
MARVLVAGRCWRRSPPFQASRRCGLRPCRPSCHTCPPPPPCLQPQCTHQLLHLLDGARTCQRGIVRGARTSDSAFRCTIWSSHFVGSPRSTTEHLAMSTAVRTRPLIVKLAAVAAVGWGLHALLHHRRCEYTVTRDGVTYAATRREWADHCRAIRRQEWAALEQRRQALRAHPDATAAPSGSVLRWEVEEEGSPTHPAPPARRHGQSPTPHHEVEPTATLPPPEAGVDVAAVEHPALPNTCPAP